jgi:NADPH:quinone reductase-like Zn-dependent oxidoreductase
MQAIVQESFNGIEDLKIRTFDTPKVNPFSALIETKFTPVLPYDWMTEDGSLKSIRPVKLPITVGYSFSGTVKSVGAMAKRSLVGKNVIGFSPSGTSKQFNNIIVTPFLFPLPENVSLEAGATIIGGADAALNAVNASNVTKADTVLVTGASGGVGTYIIQFLKLQGIRTIVLGNPSNKDFLKEVGADEFIDYTQSVAEQLTKYPEINKVIDTVGSTQLLAPISNQFNQLKIVSLSLPRFMPSRPEQSFKFTQGALTPGKYKMILNLLDEGKLTAYIQDVYQYQDVIKAQQTSKTSHSSGRILLKY